MKKQNKLCGVAIVSAERRPRRRPDVRSTHVRGFASLSRCPLVAQRISVAVQLSLAQEVAEALGLSVAADPRAR